MTRADGLTLPELVITLCLVAILASITVPALSDFLRDNQMITGLHHFRGQLMLARNLAIKSGTEVVICKSSGRACSSRGGWEKGWIAFADRNGDRQCTDTDVDDACDSDNGQVFVRSRGLGTDNLTVNASGNPRRLGYVRFTPRGDASGFLSTFSFCDDRGIATARGLKLIMTGRVVAARPGEPLLRCP